MSYDSRADTYAHAARVAELTLPLITSLSLRVIQHDASKTRPPEVEAFDRVTPRLAELEYGSEEYRASLREIKPAIEHHYEANRHHPEYFGNGIAGMTLVDLIEMLADWKAAGERTKTGDMRKSLDIQRARFGISDQLFAILENTAREYGWLEE